tara:strand:+ start:117 stop:929 length:813 start_codon:yes stop_codon:yes gene_type:complete
MKKLLSVFYYKLVPLFLKKIICNTIGNFRHRELLALHERPWYAYGLLKSAEFAKKKGYSRLTAIEFGVASGRGIRVLSLFKKEIEKIIDIKIDIVGFDTGKGMPKTNDYRDLPDKYIESDFPMINKKKIESYGCKLVLGDLKKTIPAYKKHLSKSSPIGFFAMDVDIYSSTKYALKLFNENYDYYLPYVFCYFDESGGRHHFTKFTGELLAIKEFNDSNKLRKIDKDRGVWNEHKLIPNQIWYDRCFILHLFDHRLRKKSKTRKKKIINF